MKKYKLFTYGTFQNKEIQSILFNKLLKEKDAYIKNFSKYNDETPYLYLENTPDSVVKGKVVELTEDELLICEQWEEVPLYEKFNTMAYYKNGASERVIYYNKNPIGKKSKLDFDNHNKLINANQNEELIKEAKDFAASIKNANNNFTYGDVVFINSWKINHLILGDWTASEDKNFLEVFNSVYGNIFEEEIDKKFVYYSKNDFAFSLNIKLGDDIHNAKLIMKRFDIEDNEYYVSYIHLFNISTKIDLLWSEYFSRGIDIKLEHEKTFMKMNDWLKKNEIKTFLPPHLFLYSKDKINFDVMKNVALIEVDENIIEENINQKLKRNIANYTSAEIFSYEKTIFEFPKTFKPWYKERLSSQILTLFILEIILYKQVLIEKSKSKIHNYWKINKALKDNNHALSSSILEIEQDQNLVDIIDLSINEDIFIYPSSKRLMKNLFGILDIADAEKNKANLKKEMDIIRNKFIQKEKMEIEKKEMKKTALIKLFAFIFSLASSSSLLILLFTKVFNLDEKMSIIVIFSIIILITIAIMLPYLYSLIKNKKNIKNQIEEFNKFKKNNDY